MTLPRQPHPRYSESHRVAVLFLSDRVQPVVKADGVSIPHGGLPLQLSAALGAGVRCDRPMSEQDALDILTLVSLIHRKLDGTTKLAAVSP